MKWISAIRDRFKDRTELLKQRDTAARALRESTGRELAMVEALIAADRMAEGVRQVTENDFRVPFTTPEEYLRDLRTIYLAARERKK